MQSMMDPETRRPRPGAIGTALLAGILALLLSACFRSDVPDPSPTPRPSSLPLPVIHRITPASVSPGQTVTLSGVNFRVGLEVRVGGREARVLSVISTSVIFEPPGLAAGNATVMLRNSDGTRTVVENGLVIRGGAPPVPEVESVGWGRVPLGGGTPVRVHGRGFETGAAVQVGGVDAANVEVVHAGCIEAVAPPAFGGPGPRTVVVTNPSGSLGTLTAAVTYVDVPAERCLIFGRISFQKRQVLAEGLSGAFVETPCPFVRVEVSGPNPATALWTTYADAHGDFIVVADAQTTLRIRAYSAARIPPSPVENLRVHASPEGMMPLYGVESAPFDPPDGGAVQAMMVVPAAEPFYPAGAFNILCVGGRAGNLVQGELGEVLPLLRVFWFAGNATMLYTSYFDLEDLGSGSVPVIHVLGGVQGFLERTDTDEYDDQIVAHEFAHFVQHALSVNASPGGRHAGGMIVPNLAFSEGFANWFGCAATRSDTYGDTSGYGDAGTVRIAFSCENVWWQYPVVYGPGSEQSVTEILWDLTDGSGTLADRDGDGLTLPVGEILAAVRAFDPGNDFPSIFTLLGGLENRGAVSAAALGGLLAGPENQGFSYPPPPGNEFPARLDGCAGGFVDATQAYYPPGADWRFWLAASLGNPKNPYNGYNARKYFAFQVNQSGSVTVRLEIQGSGTWPEDLDLFLLDSSHNEILSSMTQSPVEQLTLQCMPGQTYFLEIRGWQIRGATQTDLNRAGFLLFLETN
jgi:hypothetical protein